ncbi:MAG: hypothetical protein HS108_11445 [Planctomycetes bacterium]|jgi:hypothetical protein|nr:hypothetical protein [Planctomycetota bacterium]MCL4729413.1 hypothetical protein [Planctomycetota bacterium]
MDDKKKFVASVFEHNIDVTIGELSRQLRQAFGKGVGFVEIKRLREAWLGGTFDRVWDEIFRDEPTWQASAAGAKERGDRRKKLKVRGRRRVDKDKISLAGMRGHLVVYRTPDGFLNSQQFDSRRRAEELVRQLLREGIKADQIGWFRRNELDPALAA